MGDLDKQPNGGRLWCSLCLFLPVRQRPHRWQYLPLTIMNGQLVCDAHTGYVQGGAHSQALKALQESLTSEQIPYPPLRTSEENNHG